MAKVDATENDLPPSLNLSGVPAVLLFPGNGSGPVAYGGERTWGGITAFVSARTGVPVAADYRAGSELDMDVFRALAEDFPEDYRLPSRWTGEGRRRAYLALLALLAAAIALVFACAPGGPPSPHRAAAPRGGPSPGGPRPAGAAALKGGARKSGKKD